MNQVKSKTSKILILICDIAIVVSVLMAIMTILDRRSLGDITLQAVFIFISIINRLKAVEDMKTCDLSYKREKVEFKPREYEFDEEII